MRNKIWICGLVLQAAGVTAFAQGVQNVDVSVMLGAAGSGSETISTLNAGTSIVTIQPGAGGPTVAGTAGLATEVAFGYQTATFSAGSLYLELPLIWLWRGSGSVTASEETSGSISGISRNSWYVLPGVRWKIPTGTRMSFYPAIGGGVGIFHQQETVIANSLVNVTAATATKPVFDFGGGIDLRISRWLSLRLDVRDYVHHPGFGTGGLNHPSALAGVAFHF
jgi:hypothetical protein